MRLSSRLNALNNGSLNIEPEHPPSQIGRTAESVLCIFLNEIQVASLSPLSAAEGKSQRLLRRYDSTHRLGTDRNGSRRISSAVNRRPISGSSFSTIYLLPPNSNFFSPRMLKPASAGQIPVLASSQLPCSTA